MNKEEIKEKIARLLSSERFFERSNKKQNDTDGRNPFESDYSRLVLSSYVRRLQDKTQVFPLAQNDFVRTRLTHSLEVSCFAKGLGLGVEKYLKNNGFISNEQLGFIPAILETAGLVHDVGNPPFGHFGEESIRQFFKTKENMSEKTKAAYETLSPQQQKDFECFDGNVQGFHILKSLGRSKHNNSFNLTFALLSTVIKYPFSSLEGNQEKSGDPFRKKFGYFESEEKDYKHLIQKLGLKAGQRHPLAYLAEAADDIAYSVCDIEDGCKLGLIKYADIENEFNKYPQEKPFLTSLTDKEYSFEEDKELFFQQLRIQIHSRMIDDTVSCFNENLESLIEGTFDSDLLSRSKSANLRRIFKNLGLINFSHPSVLKSEILGDTVITYMLKMLTQAVFGWTPEEKPSSKNNKILSLICSRPQDLETLKSTDVKDNYKKFQKIVDYISGTTDSYALHFYQEFNGITQI